MVAYLERDDFVYPSNLDDSDFEGNVRSSPDVTLEIFDPPPPVPFSSDSETEIVEENENNPNANEPNSYGLQETPIYNYSSDHEMKKISRMVGIGLICLTKKTLDLNTDLSLGSNSFFWTHA